VAVHVAFIAKKVKEKCFQKDVERNDNGCIFKHMLSYSELKNALSIFQPLKPTGYYTYRLV
jgi:hypothetical protein